MAAGPQNSGAFDPLNSQLNTLNFLHGQIHRTKNQSQPPLWCAALWTIESARTEELSSRHAWAEGLTAQAIRLRHRVGRKAEASLPVRPARKAIPPDFPDSLAQARSDR